MASASEVTQGHHTAPDYVAPGRAEIVSFSEGEDRNNIKILMFKIQNKNVLILVFSVLVIDILVIRICFEFRYSNFGFPRPS
jgi:hypothetical protein